MLRFAIPLLMLPFLLALSDCAAPVMPVPESQMYYHVDSTPPRLLPLSYAVAAPADAIGLAQKHCVPDRPDVFDGVEKRRSDFQASLSQPWIAKTVGFGTALHWEVAGGKSRINRETGGFDRTDFCRAFTAKIDPVTGTVDCGECIMTI